MQYPNLDLDISHLLRPVMTLRRDKNAIVGIVARLWSVSVRILGVVFMKNENAVSSRYLSLAYFVVNPFRVVSHVETKVENTVRVKMHHLIVMNLV